MKKFEHDPTVGSRVMDLLSQYFGRARQDTTSVLWQFHCDAKETSLLKFLSKFEHNPTVGSRVTHLLNRYSRVVLRLSRQDVVGVE
jgi:hypothetical protein